MEPKYLPLTPLYTDLDKPLGALDTPRKEYIDNQVGRVLFDTLKPVFSEHGLALPDRKQHVTVPQRLLEAMRRAIWDFFKKMEIWENEITLSQRHLQVWTDDHFGSVHKARKTILRLTVSPLSDSPSTSYELGDMILAYFKNIKVGKDYDLSFSKSDYDRMHAACKSCIGRVASVKLLDLYRHSSDDEYKQVIEYFGADYLSALLRCNYFDNFKTMSELVAYINEDTDKSSFSDDKDIHRTEALCLVTTRTSLYQALMKSMTEELKLLLGLNGENPNGSLPDSVDIFVVLDDIRALEKGSLCDIHRKNLCFEYFLYEETDKFYNYVEKLIKVPLEPSFAKEPQSYWGDFYQVMYHNFQYVPELSDYLKSNCFDSWKSAVCFLRRVARWWVFREKPKVEKNLCIKTIETSKIHKVYTDGSVIDETAGAGVYFGKNHPDNLSTRLQASFSTSQQAELGAILLALETIQKGPRHTYELYTDSHYSIKCLTEGYKKWKANGWKSCKGAPVANRDLIEQVFKKLSKTPNVTIKLVHGHSGNEGNDAADKLARDAVSGV